MQNSHSLNILFGGLPSEAKEDKFILASMRLIFKESFNIKISLVKNKYRTEGFQRK